MANSDVLLQVQQDGNFVPVDVSTSDERGEFRFDGLPLDEAHLYLTGATRDGVFYPGPRVLWWDQVNPLPRLN